MTLVPIANNSYAANDINHVAFRQNSLTSVQVGDDTYQFAAYYRTVIGSNTRRVTVARRQLGSTTWDIFNYVNSFSDPNSNATDSHNAINFGIDGDGYMHLSWGMHNNNLIYRKSTTSVLNSNPIAFGTTNLPMTGANENSVTYPQFYNLPDGDLLGFYRNGGSGDGNTFLNRYDTATDTWSAVKHPLFDGITSSVNAYFNTLAFDSQGVLHATWTDRSTPAFQTNHNIYYARSPDQGATWTKMDGTPYTLPITEATAEMVVPIPENSTLINQASMTVDQNDRPLVATWWAPGTSQGDFTRQYMLSYHDGNAWQTSQISNRPTEPLQNDSTVRDLARPLVMVDDENRTVVVMRYDQRDNVVTIGYSEDNQNWNLIDLTTQDMGDWEPTYDAELWKRENKLHLLYQPVGLGSTSSAISVLEWDAKAFFFDLAPEPLTLQINRSTGETTIVNPAAEAAHLTAYSITSPGGQLGPARWNSLADQATASWTEYQSLPTSVAESTAGSPLTLANATTAAIGNPYVGKPVSFRVDAPADLTFEYTADGETRTGTIQYTGESLNNLALLVDPETGLARLENTSPFPVSIDGYTVSSASASLAPSQWTSLDDQGASGNDWHEANVGPGRVSELQANGATPLQPGDAYEMGQLFAAASGELDLVFDFLLAGASASLRGVVLYTDVRLPGDFNDDGLVDAADYTLWRDTLGQSVAAGTGADGNLDGAITSVDYTLWKTNFGRSLAAPSGSGSVAKVPEPHTAILFAIFAMIAAAFVRPRC